MAAFKDILDDMRRRKVQFTRENIARAARGINVSGTSISNILLASSFYSSVQSTLGENLDAFLVLGSTAAGIAGESYGITLPSGRIIKSLSDVDICLVFNDINKQQLDMIRRNANALNQINTLEIGAYKTGDVLSWMKALKESRESFERAVKEYAKAVTAANADEIKRAEEGLKRIRLERIQLVSKGVIPLGLSLWECVQSMARGNYFCFFASARLRKEALGKAGECMSREEMCESLREMRDRKAFFKKCHDKGIPADPVLMDEIMRFARWRGYIYGECAYRDFFGTWDPEAPPELIERYKEILKARLEKMNLLDKPKFRKIRQYLSSK